jgi:GNAT superfamily N-acetyltransferase
LSAPVIRPAVEDDAEAVARLLGELEYPTEPDAARERLGRLLARDDTGVFLVEIDGDPAALAAYHVTQLLHREQPSCRLTALVTSSRFRRHGAARLLVDEVESHARRHGCFRLEVTGAWLPEARAFYESSGFAERRRRLVKPLD